MSGTNTVAVLGSCITRDNFNSRFNADYRRWFEVGATTNQSSMIALMSPPAQVTWEQVKEMQPYGVWTINADLYGEALDQLAEKPTDLLVLDFFGDVHFGVIRMADGSYITNNRWRLPETDLHERLQNDPDAVEIRWQDDPDAYFALWTDAMDRFADYLATHCPKTRVVVHWGFNARLYERDGEPQPGVIGKGPDGRRAHRRGNAFWTRLNEHATATYGWERIDLTREWYVSFDKHPWGPFPVHYTMDYYHRFLAELHRIALHDELSPELAEQVDVIAAAATERVRADLAWWRAQERRLAERAAEDELPALARARARWRRRRTPAPARPTGLDTDREALEALRDRVPAEAFERIAALPSSADEHIAWLESYFTTVLTDRFGTTS